MNLTHDAMLVSLRINSWSGRLYDRQASQQVAVHNDADTSAGRYNKRLCLPFISSGVHQERRPVRRHW